MKKGFFRLQAPLLFATLLTLPSCASLMQQFTETDDPKDYDRGYAAEEKQNDGDCAGRFCRSSGGEGDGRALASINEEATPVQRAIDSRDVILGMTRQDVMQSWGEPRQREVAGRGPTGNERWTYGTRYSLDGSRTVIFENGRVAGWER